MSALPIDEFVPEIVRSLAGRASLVLTASPGAGKTTRVPPALLDALDAQAGEIWVLEPRRIAARAAARHVARERGVVLGDEVGYVVRHEVRRSAATRLVFVTEGVLLRRISADPALEGLAAVVLDEFHERHVETDLALAMLRDVQATLRPELQVLVMSATLQAEPLARYLDAPVLAVPGRSFEVRTIWDERRDDAPLPQRIARACEELVDVHGASGGVLVFVPGRSEIDAALAALGPFARRRGFELLPLHGSLPPEAQDRAIRAGVQPKLVVATNVAESSITVDGIAAVIDSGLARVLRHDPRRGIDALRTETISMASAAQRRGRAGRQGPGLCRRLWTQGEERLRADFDEPELARVELAGPLLMVRAFAGKALASFEWFEAPSPERLAAADRELTLLGATTAEGALTPLGRAMLALPVAPRLARLLLAAREYDCVFAAAAVAALLGERDPFVPGHGDDADESASDLEGRVQTLEEAQGARSDAELRRLGLEPHGARRILRTIRQLVRHVERRQPAARALPEDEALARALLAGFPDRVARRGADDGREADLATGQRVQLRPGALPHGVRLFLATELRELDAGRIARVSHPLPLETAWLDPALVTTCDEARFVAREGRVRAVRRTRYLGLTLAEEQGGDAPAELARPLLEEALQKDPARWLGPQPALRALQARVRWLREQGRELPELDDAGVVAFALELIDGTRLASLRELDLAPLVLAREPGLAATLEHEAPAQVRLPTGRLAAIDYAAPAGPTVAARIQELFGLRSLPRLAGGRVPLVLELQGPHHRPVQVTSDLAGFWERGYPLVRKELKRRYPKHAWPDDPLAAEPESRPRRR